MTSRNSRTSGGAIHDSASRPRRSRSTRSLASRSSFLTRRFPQLFPNGWARWTLAPISSSTSAAQYQPNVASITTSGSGPAAATASASAMALLSIRTLPKTSPAAFFRTITDRRRCRSIPTYCRSTGASFLRREGVAFVGPSVFTLGPSRPEEVPEPFTCLAIPAPVISTTPTRRTRQLTPRRRPAVSSRSLQGWVAVGPSPGGAVHLGGRLRPEGVVGKGDVEDVAGQADGEAVEDPVGGLWGGDTGDAPWRFRVVGQAQITDQLEGDVVVAGPFGD